MIRGNARRGATRGVQILLFIGVVLGLAAAMHIQHRRFSKVGFRAYIFQQRIKLPSSDVLKFVTLGYDNVYADWLWLQSIQAFGSGWRTENNTTEPIYLYFDTLTDLDPHNPAAYRFANLIIGDQRGDYQRGQDILRKGCFKLPFNYDIPYLGVYGAMWASDSPIDARWFAQRIARIPSAPSFMKRLNEYIERKEGRYDVAFEMNVRYFLEYVVQRNEIERAIVVRRMQDLLDRWHRDKLSRAIERYIDKNSEHPTQIEQVLAPEYLQPYDAYSIGAFVAAVEAREASLSAIKSASDIPQSLVDQVARESRDRIVGLPPEPFDTWYFIYEPARQSTIEKGYVQDSKKSIAYLYSANDLMGAMNRFSMGFQEFLLGYYRLNEGRLPTDEEVKSYLLRDPLGGHYVYDRNAPESPVYGVFYSTAAKRIIDKQEPRIRARGPGPWPWKATNPTMTLQPRLSDFPVDEKWGRERGYILPDGTEVWESSEEKAAREASQKKMNEENAAQEGN